MGELRENHKVNKERGLATSPSSIFPGPDQLPYRTDILAALVAIKTIWAMPEYTRDLFRLAMPDLDLNESNIIYALGYRGPLRPMDLGDLFAMRRSNVSKVINRLEARGFVIRQPEETDKRSVRIHLTVLGERAARRLYAAGDMQVAELTRGWTEKEVREFSAYSARFSENAQKLAERLRRGEVPELPEDAT